MAQAVFEEHPLEQYLRDAGETAELMPGNAPDFMVELNEQASILDGDFSEAEESRLSVLAPYIEILSSFIPSHMPKHTSPFAERFKYDVISSSLLATSLPLPHSHTIRSHSPSPPGKLDHAASSGSQSDSSHQATHSLKSFSTDPSYWLSSIPIAFAILFMSAGYYFLAILVISATALFVYISATDPHAKHDMAPALESLHDLIVANDVWDSVVQESVAILEKDEQNAFAPGPSSPSSSLRVALSSSLHTTQTQCDNVRQLFIALTSPTEFSQLSEMYAPPSPGVFKATLPPPMPQPGLRPISLPGHHLKRTSSFPPRVDSKRTTWNGSYSTLASAGSPTMQTLKRREKRRSDLSAILSVSGSLPYSAGGSSSVPATPSPASLGEVHEQEESYFEDDDDPKFPHIQRRPEIDGHSTPPPEEDKSGNDTENFGSAALGLRRQRKSGGLETLGLSPRYLHFPHSSTATAPYSQPSPRSSSATASPHLTPRSPRSPRTRASSTVSSSSRFTSLQTPRHPLSLSALNQSVHGALASKRYACSHLLALRFDEDESDEGYWEDVRSVMSLLTSTIADASSRLVEALDQMESVRLKDENPSPTSLAAHSRSGSFGEGMVDDLSPSSFGMGLSGSSISRMKKARTMEQMASFAPIPSHLSRFAAHVDAISSALNDARENLEQCVASLREEPLNGSGSRHSRSYSHSRGSSRSSQPNTAPESHTALLAYERLRRELGLALRECERGRERLLDLTMPPRGDDLEGSDPADDVPGLSHDTSDDSDKPESNSPADDDVMSMEHAQLVAVVGDNAEQVDDATSHLLLATSSHHLPPPGLEQVFESEAGNAVLFNRERSKLSREERIQLAKKARESGRSILPPHQPAQLGDDDDDVSIVVEKTGPGVDVVQELKDVIWKVGERRRKMTDGE